MSEPFIGEIRVVGFNFAPRGWAMCNGQLMSIAQNTALFSLLGTQFGGDGRVTFGLPDLRGRVPLGQGQGPGLPNYTIGELAGEAAHTLISNEMPMHNHLVSAANTSDATSPANAYLGSDSRGTPLSTYNGTSDGTTMNPQSIGLAGGN